MQFNLTNVQVYKLIYIEFGVLVCVSVFIRCVALKKKRVIKLVIIDLF